MSNIMMNWSSLNGPRAVMRERIIRNAALCKKCGDVIESTHRHDFVSCKCGAIFVDGGHEYLRRGAKNFDTDFEDKSEVEELP